MSSYDVLLPKENFRGKSYGEWAAEWWNWLLSEDADTYLQKDPVLFLRGAYDYEAAVDGKRNPASTHYSKKGNEKIEISEGTAIFFPVIEAEFNSGDSDPDDGGKKITTEAEMRYFARRDIDEGGRMGATIQIGNGPRTKIVKDLKDYRAESPLFKLVVSDNSPLKAKLETLLPGNGPFDAVTDGYWILIRSLPPSEVPYQIHFEAEGRHGYYNSGTYDIKVESKQTSKQTSRVEDKSDSLITGNSLGSK